MKKITLPDGRIATFPDTAKPGVIGKTIARLMMADGGKSEVDEEEKQKKEAEEKKAKLEDTRHKEKVAVGKDGVKASQERNKAATDHVKATQSLGKSLEGNAAKIAAELAALRKSLEGFSDLGQEISASVDALTKTIATSAKMLGDIMKKPKKILRSERGALTGIRHED